MRPDSLAWRNTNEMASLEFRPRNLIYHRIVYWIVGIVLLHMGLSVLAWHLLQTAQAQTWLAAAMTAVTPASATASTPPPPAATPQIQITPRGSDAGARQSVSFTPEPAAAASLSPLTYVGASQVAAFLVLLMIVVPTVRRSLRNHCTGLEELFDGIRALTGGASPRPLAAGQPGEVGYLIMAFNDMSRKLIANQQRLQEANATLEQRVAERTRALQEAAKQLDEMASTDPLTGLSNRRAIEEEGHKRFEYSAEQNTDIACLLIDLDNFKQVNDRCGHKKGDEVLRIAADTLRAGCRGNDLIARFGGDELLILLDAANAVEIATRVAARIQEMFQKKVEESFEGRMIQPAPSMSIGIASRITSPASTFEELLIRADAALYRAKAAGKGRAELYQELAA